MDIAGKNVQKQYDTGAAGDAPMGVAIVTYNSSDVIIGCLDSLLACDHSDLRIVICDNNSPDDTLEVIRAWAVANGDELGPGGFLEVAMAGPTPPPLETLGRVTLLRASLNAGFGAGTNAGLASLLRQDDINLFWVLNPDCMVGKETARAYARAAAKGPFSLMGGRILYLDAPNDIQSDGGRVSRWTGLCHNANWGLAPDTVATPDPGSLDYIPGANVVASRGFIEAAGLMPEDYFLYYEEVDWAMRRGDLALRLCDDAVIHHHGGTAIGSGMAGRRASGFANYFNYRNRLIFMRRHFPTALVTVYIYSMLKIVKLLLLGAWDEASGAFCGLHQMAPPSAVRARLSADAAALAFGRRGQI